MKEHSRAATLLSVMAVLALAATARPADVRTSIDGLLASRELSGASVGVRIIDVATGEVIYSYHPDDVLSVASNAKLVTTSAALDMLGPDFALSTTLAARGEIKEGSLYGDLILIGKGDPSISVHWTGPDVTAPLRQFAANVKAAGINTVIGDIVVDDFYFDREFLCPSWPETQWIQWYEAPVAAMAFNDNCVDVTVGPGSSVGSPAELVYAPAIGYVNLLNDIKTISGRKGHGYAFRRAINSNDVTAKGGYDIKAGPANDNFTIYDPSMYLATALRKTLEDAGVKVNGTIRLIAKYEMPTVATARVLSVHRISLAEAVKYCNLHSQNLYAEMIFKTLGREVALEGSFAGGSKAVDQFLAKIGIGAGTHTAADGSGLSRETRYSAKVMTEVLRYMYTSRGNVALRDSMPLAGYDGTMEKRLTEPEYRGKVRAKTGYILGTSALSGYARTANGKTLAFSIVFNRFKGSNRYFAKPTQDNICRILVNSTP
jgi:serine-type D-Ala-D-Ala carboxypeptidase/endopeptidase (penicillin-binding protein 4)